ncbi:uroporphyrinogen-III synthase [Rossellomorea sp. KS-H15a]|uniref:uroporphyrinogen-III synthase n=1 Tax=Rossellomorea sp. KS-H15a TaxID=2963940 RepID=UPI0020C6B59B|nr:uroporphyrinogen-III synthase [Rossellomorea sp. KS-H15a]UTE76517.1 uroporphyrinogen-III synthase [Rossellomorea sp. KS-H15a]
MKGKRPLEQIKVLITRGSEGSSETGSLIENEGGVPILVPLLHFHPHIDPLELSLHTTLHTYEWIIFTSKNGVKFFLEALERRGIPLSSYTGKFAAVGTKTEQYCHKFGIPISFVPENFTGDDFAEEFISNVKPDGHVLIPKGNLARNVIATELASAGVSCQEWIVYETALPENSFVQLKTIIEQEQVDIITFTSSSTVHHFMKVIRHYSLYDHIRDIPIACIGPITKKTAEQYGLHVKICPSVYTVNEMVNEIKEFISAY